MAAFALLLACLALGALSARADWLPARHHPRIDGWVLNVALPAMVLRQIPALEPSVELLFAAAAPWLVVGGALLLFPWLGRRLGWPRPLVGCLVLTCGFGNTAFLGLRMIAALQGPAALPIAVFADQAGSFLALSSIGLAAAAAYGGGEFRYRAIALRVLRFPPFIALLLAVAVGAAGTWPPLFAEVLDALAATLAPVALFSVGLRFRLRAVAGRGVAVALGLGWKLLLAPLIVWGLALGLGTATPVANVSVLQAAMAPMITAGILAMRHGLEPPLAAAMLSAGILLSFLSVPLWSLALG